MITYILLAGAAIIGVALFLRPKGGNTFKNVTIGELDQLLESPDSVLIDVRTPKEIHKGVIGKPMHIELGNAMQQKFKALEKDKKYILYCRSGRRSALASRMMVNMGFEDVNNLSGGYLEWINSKQT